MMLWALFFLGCHHPEPDPGVAPTPKQVDTNLLRFIAIGDSGHINQSQRSVAVAAGKVCRERGCDFGLLLGDNLYAEGMASADDIRMDQATVDMYGNLGFPFYMVLGNHDYGWKHQVEPALWQVDWANRTEGFHLPKRTYTFSAGPAAFWALDTDTVFWEGHTGHAAWLSKSVAASKAQWKVVFGHHPFRSNGRHGNAGNYDGVPLPYVRGRPLEKFFEGELCGKVDFYLSGHDHALQWIRHCGVELVVSGAGSAPTPLVDRGNDPEYSASMLGFSWIELRPDG
ncbi:MAG: hypothetical protein HN348_28060, partial [Proteobacteria bacterium]|nr:hypothetical protein [Pseudomonadota bacterium]